MYTDLLTRIKNAQAVKKKSVKAPYSKMDERILEVLEKYHYIAHMQKKGRTTKKIIEVTLQYHEGKGVINEVKFVSKPSQRIYTGYGDIKPVRRGYGLMVLSTPKGIVSGQDAKKMKVGGEILFTIW